MKKPLSENPSSSEIANGMRTQSPADFLPSPFMPISAEALIALKMKPRDFILAPWLPEKGLAMIYGPRGIGKTHLVLGCAWAIARGGGFLSWHADRPRKVLIIDGEMPGEVLQERLIGISCCSTEAPPPDYLQFLAIDMQEQGLDISRAEDQEVLEAIIADIDVIIIDNIGTLTGSGKENDGESWLPVQGWALRQRRSGKSVVFVHHAGKGGQQRGTSRREGKRSAFAV